MKLDFPLNVTDFLAQRVRRNRDRIFLRFAGEEVSYAQFEQRDESGGQRASSHGNQQGRPRVSDAVEPPGVSLSLVRPRQDRRRHGSHQHGLQREGGWPTSSSIPAQPPFSPNRISRRSPGRCSRIAPRSAGGFLWMTARILDSSVSMMFVRPQTIILPGSRFQKTISCPSSIRPARRVDRRAPCIATGRTSWPDGPSPSGWTSMPTIA